MTTFETSVKMSTYLVAFAVTGFSYLESEDKKYRMWAKPQLVDKGEYALNMTQLLMKELNIYTEIPYSASMKKLDQIALTSFSPNAMENWGFITWRQNTILFDKQFTRTSRKLFLVKTLANEIAHQWFGNLVSPETWKSLWLNEGFATYLEYFIVHKIKPEWRLNEVFVIEAQQSTSFLMDAEPNSRPLNEAVDSTEEIESLFDGITYQKSASIIRMMANILSEEVFQKGVRSYLKHYQYKAVNSEDLLDFLNDVGYEVNVNGTLKRPLHDVMREWIEYPGYPVLNVKMLDHDLIQVSQERFLYYGPKSDTKWWVPINFATARNPNFNDTTPTYWLNPLEEAQNFSIGHGDEWFLINVNQSYYYRVNYDQGSWNRLALALHQGYKKIPPISRAQFIDDSFAMARTGRMNYSMVLGLSLYLNEHEDDYIPWQAFFNNVHFLNDRIRYSKQYYIFRAYLRYILKKVTKSVGFKPKPDDDDNTKMLRANVVKWSCKGGEMACKNFTDEQFDAWLNQFTDFRLDVDLQADILCAGLRTVNAELWNKTFNHLKSTRGEDDDDDIYDHQILLATVMPCSLSQNILRNYLKKSLDANFEVSFDWAVRGVIEQHAMGINMALKMLHDDIDAIKKRCGKNYKKTLEDTIKLISNEIVTEDHFLKLTYFILRENFRGEFVVDILHKAYNSKLWMDTFLKDIENWLIANKNKFILLKNA